MLQRSAAEPQAPAAPASLSAAAGLAEPALLAPEAENLSGWWAAEDESGWAGGSEATSSPAAAAPPVCLLPFCVLLLYTPPASFRTPLAPPHCGHGSLPTCDGKPRQGGRGARAGAGGRAAALVGASDAQSPGSQQPLRAGHARYPPGVRPYSAMAACATGGRPLGRECLRASDAVRHLLAAGGLPAGARRYNALRGAAHGDSRPVPQEQRPFSHPGLCLGWSVRACLYVFFFFFMPCRGSTRVCAWATQKQANLEGAGAGSA